MALTINIRNDLAEAATFFLRAKGLTRVYENNRDGRNLVESSDHNCILSNGRYRPVQPPDVTLFFELRSGEFFKLYVPESEPLTSAVVWISPPDILVKSPEKCTQAELNADPGATGRMYFDITHVEAVSCGMRIVHKTPNGMETICNSVPNAPGLTSPSVLIDHFQGSPVVLSDKYTQIEGSLEETLAACPNEINAKPFGNTACGQHRCRVFYANKYAGPNSYCSWLMRENSQAYCWAYDEWICDDTSCGYGNGTTQPMQLANNGLGFHPTESGPGIDGCEVPHQYHRSQIDNDLWPANIYSCGFDASQPRPPPNWLATNSAASNPGADPDGGVWWAGSSRAHQKQVGGASVLRNVLRGGELTIDFINLEWLTGKPSNVPTGTFQVMDRPTNPPHDDHHYGNANHTTPTITTLPEHTNGQTTVWIVVSIGVFSSLIVVALLVIFWYKSSHRVRKITK